MIQSTQISTWKHGECQWVWKVLRLVSLLPLLPPQPLEALQLEPPKLIVPSFEQPVSLTPLTRSSTYEQELPPLVKLSVSQLLQLAPSQLSFSLPQLLTPSVSELLHRLPTAVSISMQQLRHLAPASASALPPLSTVPLFAASLENPSLGLEIPWSQLQSRELDT